MVKDDLIGRVIGKYRIEVFLGGGGQAKVYKAYHPTLDTYVAIKVLPPYFAAEEGFIERFKQEARVIARLRHPNIVTVYDFGEEQGLTYTVMDCIEGGTLASRLGRPLPLDTALHIVEQIGRALDYAHSQGVVHRDVKPSNILMAREDWALLSDFGIARVIETTMRLTRTGVGIGTPEYMSPEQGQGLVIDGRSDLYSLGILLYEMLTGRVPFKAETPFATVLKHMAEPPTPPRIHNPNIPAAIEAVIVKALAKQPEERYPSAGDMLGALHEAYSGETALRRPVAVTETIVPVRRAPTPPGRPWPADHRPPTDQPASAVSRRPSPVPSLRPALPFNPALLLLPVLALLLITGGFVLTRRPRPVAKATPTMAAVAILATSTVEASRTMVTVSPAVKASPAMETTATTGASPTTQATPAVKASPTVQATPPATVTPVSTVVPPTSTPVPTATIPSPTPTRVPTATIPSPTPSPTPRTATPTSAPRPTATATLRPTEVAYPVPVLLEPADGASFGGGQIMLRWRWGGQLGPDEHFDVRVFREGAPHYGIGWTEKPEYLLNLDGLGGGRWLWSIAVLRGRDGKVEAVLSPESAVWSFDRTGGGPPPTPSPLPTR